MEDGIGDTIRVSLTEDPEFEIPVCKDLVKRYEGRENHQPIREIIRLPYNPFEYTRRETTQVSNIGSRHVPVVVADFMKEKLIVPEQLKTVGYSYDKDIDKWTIHDAAADYIYTSKKKIDFALPGTLKVITDFDAWVTADRQTHFPLYQGKEYITAKERSGMLNFIAVNAADDTVYEWIESLHNDNTVVLCIWS